MSLRAKLLLAQAPILAALVLLAFVASSSTASLGRASRAILRENYRSVLAAQRMKEYAERLDSGSLFVALGHRGEGAEQIRRYRDAFERELAVEESNITEGGETEIVHRLRGRWTAYAAALDGHLAAAAGADLSARYFAELDPAFRAVKEDADALLAMNQDAMARKSDAAESAARRIETLLAVIALAGCLVAVAASVALTTRILRPLSVLGQTAKRIGEGDLAVRARVAGRDEIATLAGEFNAMAERIESYRRSSLGELLEAQSAMQAAIDSLPDPVLVIGLDDRVLRVNAAAESRVGASSDAPAATATVALPAPLLDAIERARRHVLGGRGPYVPRGLEEAVRTATPDGEVHLLARATPVYSNEGAVVATTVVLQDVTRLVRSDERRKDLVATVAHEFRTPLTSLRMAIHLCTEQAVGPLTASQADLLFAAREDCERLQSVVDELLDASRTRPDGDALVRRDVELSELVEAAVEQNRRAAEVRGVRLVAEVLPGAGTVSIDREPMLVALANLVANAVRHSPDGELVVVRAARTESGARIEVADRGAGIAPEHRDAIFERGFQVPGEPSGGAGLGLFIARETVRAHGGRIGVDGEPGRGSTFWIELPQAPEAAQ